MSETGVSIRLVDGPDDGETVVVDGLLGKWIVSAFGAQGEAVYRVDYSSDPLVAEFEGFRQRNPLDRWR